LTKPACRHGNRLLCDDVDDTDSVHRCHCTRLKLDNNRGRGRRPVHNHVDTIVVVLKCRERVSKTSYSVGRVDGMIYLGDCSE